MKNNKYVITNLDEFTESSRRLVFKHFGEASSNVDISQDNNDFLVSLSTSEEKELDSILPLSEAKNIVTSLTKAQTNKKAKDTQYIINYDIFIEILEALNARLVSNILMNLSKKGIIESAYDASIDDFVFWIKNENNTDQS
jgi:hypothetical protein